MGLFKDIWVSYRWDGGYKDMLKKNAGDTKIGPTIYGTFKDYGAFIKKHRCIHKIFKHRIIVPILLITKRVLGKYLVKDIPESLEYKNIKIFNDAYDKSLFEWNETFRVQMAGLDSDPAVIKRFLATYQNNKATKYLELLKQMMLTGVMMDTAYWGFFDILMFNIAKDMNKTYHTEKPVHLFYTSKSINDVSYFMARRMVDQLQLINVLTPEQREAEYLKKKEELSENQKKSKKKKIKRKKK